MQGAGYGREIREFFLFFVFWDDIQMWGPRAWVGKVQYGG